MLEIKNLNKRYGSFYALRNLNLTVEDGELFGFVGANGAGKTTTMRICVGLLGADSGEVFIDGKRMLSNHRLLSNKVGYVPDFFGVYPSLTAMEYMQFFAASYGLVGTDADNLCMDLLRLVKLDHKAETDVNGLSRGMKQRLCLARGLVHNPDILFLDEPASGLDPRARFELKEILKNLSSMGKTIIISSHILPELSEMCTTIGIIDHGQMMLKGTIDEIHRAAAMQSPLIVVVEEHAVDDTFRILQENPNVQHINARANMIEVVFTGNKMDEAALLSTLVSAGIPILSFNRQEGSLEALFMQVINRSAQERKAMQNPGGRKPGMGPNGRPPMGAPMGQPYGGQMGAPMNGQYGWKQPAGAPMNRPYGGPMNQPMGQPMNQPYGGPMNQPMGQPVNQSYGGSMNQPMGQPMNQPYGGPMNQPMGQPYGGPMGAPMNQSMGQPMNQPMNQPMGAPVNQSYGEPMNQPMGQPGQPYGVENDSQIQGGMRP
ncbi:MAG: ATP-binding cassette domain-containing protein [Lachnospiraceae bacterium]|nr:ATP-binding cassette domain-containing protein [Lachnospiraceae bacterium]